MTTGPGSANTNDGTGCAGRRGATADEDQTNDNGEPPPVKDGQSSKDGPDNRGQSPTATTNPQRQRESPAAPVPLSCDPVQSNTFIYFDTRI